MQINTCKGCGKPFEVHRTRELKQQFCSKTCMSSYEGVYGRQAARVVPVDFICRECGNPFSYSPANVRAYQKKFGKNPPYCSVTCASIGRRKDADERHKTNCKNCGKEFHRNRKSGSGTIYREQELCSKQCKNEWTSKVYRQKHGTPQITKRVRRNYTILRIPAQNGEPARRDVLEHRYVMEQQLGRKLHPGETVHHINGQRHDNRPENLELFSSRHGPGQRVTDKVQFAIEILTLYPEFARAAGYELRKV